LNTDIRFLLSIAHLPVTA